MHTIWFNYMPRKIYFKLKVDVTRKNGKIFLLNSKSLSPVVNGL